MTNTITKMKNSLEGFSIRFEQTKESENLKKGQLRLSTFQNRKKKKEIESKYLRDTIKHINIHTMALPGERRQAERIFE